MDILIDSTLETALMVAISTAFGVLLGTPLGIILFITHKGGIAQNRIVSSLVGFFVNLIRSTPYIILVIALIPFTRLIVGSSIGTLAASVSLSLAAIMLYCRSVEDALRTVNPGLIEMASAMGASKANIVTKVLIPEALPTMIGSLTLIIINLIGFSAMAGAVGGGGLGDLAIRYGYQRYNMEVIVQVIVILVVMVQLVQSTGDFLAKRLRK